MKCWYGFFSFGGVSATSRTHKGGSHLEIATLQLQSQMHKLRKQRDSCPASFMYPVRVHEEEVDTNVEVHYTCIQIYIYIHIHVLLDCREKSFLQRLCWVMPHHSYIHIYIYIYIHIVIYIYICIYIVIYVYK